VKVLAEADDQEVVREVQVYLCYGVEICVYNSQVFFLKPKVLVLCTFIIIRLTKCLTSFFMVPNYFF